jgi:uncharacterized membrane protein
MQDLHPFFVHFPVAVIPVTMILGLWSLIQKRNRGVRQAFRLGLLIAVLFAVGAVLTGDRASERASLLVPTSLLEAHEELGTSTLWLIFAAAAIESLSVFKRLGSWLVALQSLAFVLVVSAVITTALAGHRGAEMVFRYGAGVGTVFSPTGVAPATRPDSVPLLPGAPDSGGGR